MKSTNILFATFFLLLATQASGQQTMPVDYAIQARAEVQAAPPQIRLAWPAGRWDTSYTVSRKLLHESEWRHLADLPASATSYTDNDVVAGRGYEYQLRKSTSRGFPGYGYIFAGIELPLVDNRGKVILVVDETHAEEIGAELLRLRQDLVGDGWQVLRVDVSPQDQAEAIKPIIQAIYDSDPENVKAVILLGNIPVIYSGNISPDDHKHQGAWPADVYYSDVSGKSQWTDFTVHSLVAERQINKNSPGDGKYDQSHSPGPPILQVGRIDFSNLPAFAQHGTARAEVDLLRAYLNKHHQFRHGQNQVLRRAIIADFLPKGFIAETTDGDGDPVGNSGWRNFSALVGHENITELGENQYFSEAANRRGYLWSFGSASTRSFTSSPGIGGAEDFATQSPNVIFTMFGGGFYGDWKTENNFLRSALGSGNILTSAYAGLPHWHFQHMALGETIGFSTLITQHNRRGGLYPPINDGAGQVHVALLGDPTLRMHPVVPPSNLTRGAGEGVRLNWNASTDQDLRGYHVYRSATPYGPFQRLTGTQPLATTSFNDQPPAGAQTYMVRAIKLEQTPSGSYFNPSQGIFLATGTAQEPAPPAAPSNLQVKDLSASATVLFWNDQSYNADSFEIERQTGSGSFQTIATVNSGVTVLADRGLSPASSYTYRVRAANQTGASAFSAPVQASTLPSSPSLPETRVQYMHADIRTRGNWTFNYGKDGHYVISKEDRVLHAAPAFWPVDPVIPAYAQLRHSGRQNFVWTEWTDDPRALQRMPGPQERIAAAWYAQDKFSLDLTFIDGKAHRLALYFLDWDRQGRSHVVEIFDADGRSLDRRTISDFGNGVYHLWEIQGQVRIDFTRSAGPNVLLNGIFFDPASSEDPIPGVPLSLEIMPSRQIQIRGPIGSTVILEASQDLRSWSTLGSSTLQTSPQSWGSGEMTGPHSQFFRARIEP
jgi:hypothetical protein